MRQTLCQMSVVFPWMDPWLQEQSLHLEPWLGIDVELFRELFLSVTLSQICFHLSQDCELSHSPKDTGQYSVLLGVAL